MTKQVQAPWGFSAMLVRQADCGYHQRCAASRFDGRHRPAHRFRALRGPFRRRGRCGARVSWWSYVVYIIIRTYSNSPDNPAAAPKAPHSPQPASLQPSIRQVLELIRPNQQPVCSKSLIHRSFHSGSLRLPCGSGGSGFFGGYAYLRFSRLGIGLGQRLGLQLRVRSTVRPVD